jgi:DNA-binding HxlR family transcriptional regulator
MAKPGKYVGECPFEAAMQVLEGKWKLLILHQLCERGTMRFKELERRIPNINPGMLTKELKALEESGMIERHAYATIPPTVEYSLSEFGATLKPVVASICDWGRMHMDKFQGSCSLVDEEVAGENVEQRA